MNDVDQDLYPAHVGHLSCTFFSRGLTKRSALSVPRQGHPRVETSLQVLERSWQNSGSSLRPRMGRPCR